MSNVIILQADLDPQNKFLTCCLPLFRYTKGYLKSIRANGKTNIFSRFFFFSLYSSSICRDMTTYTAKFDENLVHPHSTFNMKNKKNRLYVSLMNTLAIKPKFWQPYKLSWKSFCFYKYNLQTSQVKM